MIKDMITKYIYRNLLADKDFISQDNYVLYTASLLSYLDNVTLNTIDSLLETKFFKIEHEFIGALSLYLYVDYQINNDIISYVFKIVPSQLYSYQFNCSLECNCTTEKAILTTEIDKYKTIIENFQGKKQIINDIVETLNNIQIEYSFEQAYSLINHQLETFDISSIIELRSCLNEVEEMLWKTKDE